MRRINGASQVSGEFTARMEDLLDLYLQDYDPDHPALCFDETSKQLVADKSLPTAGSAIDMPEVKLRSDSLKLHGMYLRAGMSSYVAPHRIIHLKTNLFIHICQAPSSTWSLNAEIRVD